jgi:hypothetical protein
MRAYTVHAPPHDPAPERFAFVKDGFSWPAFLFSFPWILWHGMWLALLCYVVFAAVVIAVAAWLGDGYAWIVAIIGVFVLGFEGNAIRRLSLERRGWREIGDAAGRNLVEAETRFFGDWSMLPAHRRDVLTARPAGHGEAGLEASDEPILGLFPEPER